ncbi:MAG: hypothetical protein A3B25_03600 [Candidatus Ryanbacteria bacterium RIFCSPLOWO2_01_FULL_48_26]|uniref:Uncharacterized protein n=1 Tax=Candidatus Ryanbacteria bacterium RIFCSPLOWO2_01_FULL_48_26 TaxID=1802126 RepID=A0A1G2GU58_9BACT|nr:MAG: hypothetical protein A3B25_03600 [Candidatus Ryanbacteria bacterium RIFCSPLOWO2_01_FULL_48_26]
MKSVFSKLSTYTGVAIASTLLGFTIGAVHAAWSEPTQAPPGGNIAAPLNVGFLAQSKAGGIELGAGGPRASLVADTAVGIGSADPSVYIKSMGPVGCRQAFYECGGGLDIVWGGTAVFPSTLVLGADLNPSTPNTRTTGRSKAFWISAPPYDMGQSLVAVMGGSNFTGVNEIDIGGGTASLNAATVIKFFTAGNNNTARGTETVTITPSQLQINGQIKITGGVPGNGKVLTSDGQGLASWQAPSFGGAVQTRVGAPGCNSILTTAITCKSYSDDGCTGGGCVSQYRTCNGTSRSGNDGPFTCRTYPINDPCLSSNTCIWN